MNNPLSTDRRAVLFVVVAAFLAHARALSGGYVWLDHAHIQDGLAIAEPGAFGSLFQRGFAGTGFYRPLMALSLSLDAAISMTPGFFRFVTLAWHAAAAGLTTLAARRFGASRNAAILAGVVFGVHPVTSLVADAIAFRSEAMITVALLGLVLAHLSGRPWLAALAALFGALCKETALLLAPLMIAALEFDAARREDRRPLEKRARLLGAEAVALLSVVALRMLYAPSWRSSFPQLGPLEQAGTRLGAFARSAAAVLFPIDGTICDATPVHSLASVPALLGALALACAIWLASKERVTGSLFLLALLPGLNLVPVMRFWSPHYLYVPLAFGAILGVRVLERSERRWLPVAAATCALLASISLQRGPRFASDEALWSVEVARRPECLEGQFYLGEVARESENFERAAPHYAAALTPRADVLAYVDRSSALQNLGATRWRQNRLEDAERAWTLALQVSRDPERRRKLSINLGALQLRLGHAALAVRLLEPEVQRENPFPEAVYLTASALHRLGRDPEALALMQRLPGDLQSVAIRRDKNSPFDPN